MSAVHDVVVIGAGHNGLVLAGYLARAGFDVCVLEATPEIGGVAQTREVLPGFRGNLGTNSPHNLDPAVIAELELERYGLEWIDLADASSAALLPGGERIISFRDERRDGEYDQFAPGEADRYFGLLEEMNRLGRALDVSFYEPPPSSAEIASRVPDDLRELYDFATTGSVADLVAGRLETEQAIASLSMLAISGTFIGPEDPGSAFALLQRPLYRGARAARERAKNVLGVSEYAFRNVRGGIGALTQAMGASARAAGAVIRTDSAVEQVIVEGGRAVGVVLAGGDEVRGRSVVSAMNPIATVLHLVPRDAVPAEILEYAAGVAMDGSLGKVYIGLEGMPRFAAARTEEEQAILSHSGLRMGPYMSSIHASSELARAGRWDGEPVAYTLMQTAFDDSLNPPGRHLMSVSVSYAPYRLAEGASWAEQKDAWVAHVVSWMTQHVPNLPELIVETGGLTPAELHDEFGMYEGNALHRDVLSDSMYDSRPLPGYTDYTSPVEGLFFCSVGTWPSNYMNGLGGRNASAVVSRYLS